MSPRLYFKRLGDRINGLSLRERALVVLAVFAGIFLLWDMLMMKPVRDRQARVQTELELVRDRVGQLSSAMQQLATAQARDPNTALRSEIAVLETEIGGLESRLTHSFGAVADPRQALAVLTGLLAERKGLSLISLENQPVERLTTEGGADIAGIYVHRVRLVVDTDHAGVRDYLALVARLPSGVFLESMRLTVPDWPRNRVELVLFSLTLDDNWLGI
jgi:MSHA biogenesis protein MshJ